MRARPSHHVLQRQRHAQAAADTERSHAALRVALEHFMQQGDRDARPGAADGMPEGDCTAVYVEPVAVEVQFAVAGEHLRGEGFVEFDQAELMQPEVMLLLQFAQRRYGSNPHRARIDPSRSYSRDSSERLQIVLL